VLAQHTEEGVCFLQTASFLPQVSNALFMYPVKAGAASPVVQGMLQGFCWSEATRSLDLAQRNFHLAGLTEVNLAFHAELFCIQCSCCTVTASVGSLRNDHYFFPLHTYRQALGGVFVENGCPRSATISTTNSATALQQQQLQTALSV
jgi:hypothetical protein